MTERRHGGHSPGRLDAARRIVDAFLAGEPQAAAGLLAQDAVFHSPVRDYAGAEQVVALWGALGAVLGAARSTRIHETDGEVAAFFTATVAEQGADGVLRVLVDGEDRVTEVTLMLRPLAALRAGIARMSSEWTPPGRATER